MVVVPGLAHRDQRAKGYVIALHSGAFDVPGAPTAVVGKIADQPMTGDADGNARRDAPDQPRHSANRKEENCPRQLLCSPGPLDKAVEAILGNTALENQQWRVGQSQFAMQLPETVEQDRRAVCQIWMADRLALRPDANVVLTDHAIRSSHADKSA